MILLFLFVPVVLFAEQVKLRSPAPGIGTNEWDFINFLLLLARWFITPVITLIIIYAGFELATAKGDTKKIDAGKKRLLGAVIGAAVLFGSQIVIDIIRNTGKAILE